MSDNDYRFSDKDYVLVDGLPDELKSRFTYQSVLEMNERHHLDAEFRVIMANEPLRKYLVANFANQPKVLSSLIYPYVYIKYPERQTEFCVKRITEEQESIRPDERWIDGFYQANYSLSAMISEVQFINSLRDDKIIKINESSAFPSVDIEIYCWLFPSYEPRDLA